MKLNKKGFTLVELLAVVVILLAISVIAISSISSAIERNKAKQDDAKIKVLESYGELYYQEHKNTIANGGKITWANLESIGVTEEELINSDGETFPGCLKVESNKTIKYVEVCS